MNSSFPSPRRQRPCPPGTEARRTFHYEIGRTGTAGMIVVILVLGYLMAVSTSQNALIISESRGSSAGSNRIKALSAAYAGLNFYQGLLLATTTTFDRTDWNSCRERFHFLARAPIAQLNNALYPGRQVATSTVGALAAVGDAWYNGFIHVATAQWLFASDPTIIPTEFDVPSSSLFIIKTYVASPAAGIASYVYVKSLGCYREIQNNEIIASYYAQLLARIEISTVTSTLAINRLMQMPLEYPFCATAPFFASMPVPWK